MYVGVSFLTQHQDPTIKRVSDEALVQTSGFKCPKSGHVPLTLLNSKKLKLTFDLFLFGIEIATHTRGGFSSGAGVHERGLLEADHALLQSELPGESS